MTRYGTEVVEIKENPEITEADVISQTEAMSILGVTAPAITQALYRRKFTIVWDLDKSSGMGSARMLLRSEVEAAAGKAGMSTAPSRRAPQTPSPQ